MQFKALNWPNIEIYCFEQFNFHSWVQIFLNIHETISSLLNIFKKNCNWRILKISHTKKVNIVHKFNKKTLKFSLIFLKNRKSLNIFILRKSRRVLLPLKWVYLSFLWFLLPNIVSNSNGTSWTFLVAIHFKG